MAAAALHRATVLGEEEPVARVVDLATAVDVLGGKIEFETGEEGREGQVLEHLLRTATAEAVRSHLRGIDFAPLIDEIDAGASVTTGEQVSGADVLKALPELPPTEAGEADVYDLVADRLSARTPGERASALEFALEGLFLARPVSKATAATGETVYS